MSAFVSDPQALKRLSKDKDLTLTPKGYAAIGPLNWLAFNTVRKPFDDKRVRQAIGYAMDKDKMVRILYAGFAKRAYGPIHPGSIFATTDVNHYDYNLAKAKQLLDEAGYKPDSDGVRIRTSLNFIPGGAVWKRWAELTKAQLKKAGIDVTIKASSDFRSWIKTVAGHDFDMTLDSVFNWGDPVIGVHRTYQSTNIRLGVPWHNTQSYKNPAVDAIMKQAGEETNQKKRIADYAKFQKMVVDDAPIIYINASPYHTVYNNKRVGNPPIDSIWGTCSPMDNVYIK